MPAPGIGGPTRLSFEWGGAKSATNRRKHSVSFAEAATVFGDPFSVTIPDPDHSATEVRFLDVGTSRAGRVLVVAYTERGDRIRIISAQLATRREKQAYEEGS